MRLTTGELPVAGGCAHPTLAILASVEGPLGHVHVFAGGRALLQEEPARQPEQKQKPEQKQDDAKDALIRWIDLQWPADEHRLERRKWAGVRARAQQLVLEIEAMQATVYAIRASCPLSS